jgi:hypothetical protein
VIVSTPSRRNFLLMMAAATLGAVSSYLYGMRRPAPRVAVATPQGEAEFTLMSFDQDFALDPPPPGWWHRKFWTRPAMQMSFGEKDGVKALRMETNASASMLYRYVDVKLDAYPILKWRWYIEQPIVSTHDERTHEGDDHPARFFLSMQSRSGEERRFEIIWGNRLHRGDTKFIGTFPHYVADGGDENIRQWRDEEVDLAALTKKFWPDGETFEMTAIALFCDSDETKSASVAYVADVRVAKANS